ncbi:MAG: amino acid adenylation domain-containing protein [Polyangiaceae bacterium]|nr:amino acid adenylation domain-containing protein [Polyangiaceae bacterium]
MQEGSAKQAVDHDPSLDHVEFARAAIEQPIYDRFAEQVRGHGARPAIHTPGFRWTYQELGQRVDEMALAVLSRCGAEPGRLALLFEHGAPMCAGVLAGLRAGKTYVPLDPGYPVERLRSMVDDCRPQAILAEQRCLDFARELAGEAWPVIEAETTGSAKTPFPTVDPRDPAYILYTSGSTGKPKGVVQNHRNVLHFIRAYSNNLELAASDRLTLLSSYSFDAAVMGMYGALLNGACLCPRSVRDVGFAGIAAWLRDYEVSVYHSTPTVYRHFLAECADDERFPSVRRVVMGGEPVVPRDVELFKRHFARGAVMINGLGPTESTVTLEYFVDHDTEVSGHTVPVGRPVCDTEILLLDEHGRESRTEGELVFVSEHVALGYFEQPGLTAEAFGERPEHPGKRCYRTGDLARYREDGNLEFFGRRDLQVKVHGVRIELGEIEAAVERFPGVRACIAVALPGSDGETELVAAIRPQEGVGLDQHALRSSLQQILAPAMVPSALLLFDEFPLTPTAKTDRLALRELVAAARGVGRDLAGYEARTPVEERVCDIWREVLGRPPSLGDEDFFEAGGNSLSAVRLRDRLEKAFDKEWSLGRLFELRTFRKIVEVIERGGDTAQNDGSLLDLARHGEPGGAHLYCICGIELYRPLARAIGAPHDVSGVFLPVEERAFNGQSTPELGEMARMYGEVIRAHQPRGPYSLAGVSFGGLLAYELGRQFAAAGERVAFLGVFDTILPQTIGLRRRLQAHAVLAARRGPAYLAERARAVLNRAGHLLSRDPAAAWTVGVPESEAERMARIRERMYDEALARYRCAMPRYDGDLHFFRAAESGAFERVAFPPDCNWPRYVRRCHCYEVPGGHVSMLDASNVSDLAALVRRALDGAVRD